LDYELEGQRFNWREDKAEVNARKHGVSFPEAAEALVDDRVLLRLDEEHSTQVEERYTGIGKTEAARLLRVTFRELEDGTYHIISARIANPRERRRYEQAP
jgi:hypothetical protein